MKERRRVSDKKDSVSEIQQAIHDGFESVNTVEFQNRIGALGERLSFVKGRWRGRQRDKRLKLIERMPEELILDAPIGKYLIDEIVLNFREPVGGETGFNTSKLIDLRYRVNEDAKAAVLWARWHMLGIPEARRRTKRFLDDLRQIEFLIGRNQNLKPAELMWSIKVTSRKYTGNVLQREKRLRNSLSVVAMEIGTYLRIYRLAKGGGNRDRFTGFLILQLLEDWRRVLNGSVVSNEYDRFKEFVWAAWQDLKISTKDQDGTSVRERLADHLRTQFPNGLPKSRRALEAAWGRI